MLVSGIKSRPVYSGLTPDDKSRHNIICAEAEGAEAVLAMAAAASPGFMSRSEILFTARAAAGRGLETALLALQPDVQTNFPTIATLLVRLDGLLTRAVMGSRLYITGTEGFIGECMRFGTALSIFLSEPSTEDRKSAACNAFIARELRRM
jgi:dimethylamine monooxygenase subunit C